jgi:hypothetical protein
LNLDPEARAWALPYFIPFVGTRVVVRQCGADRWNIRLARPGIKIVAGKRYSIAFLARSTRARKISFGVWQDHAPWDGLGFSEEIEVSRKWQAVGRRFVATSDDPHGYLGFWVGGEPGTVDLLVCYIGQTSSKVL